MSQTIRFISGAAAVLSLSACLHVGFGVGFGSGNVGLGVSGSVPVSASSPYKARIPVVRPSAATERVLLAQLAEVNRLRTQQDIVPLYRNPALDAYAAVRAQELAQRFSSQRSDGRDALGFIYGSKARAENIARTKTVSAQAAVAQWRADSAQRGQMLNPDFRETGLGVHVAADGQVYWVQLFAGKGSDSDYRFVE